jgi:hypothetical protein
MMTRYLLRIISPLPTPLELRPRLAIITGIIIMLSPIVTLGNPSLLAAHFPTDASISTPSTISQDGSDFTTQAALSFLTARPTNNIVNTNSFYDVVFLTATSGTIKTIEVTFPAGTTIPSGAFFNEAEKCVPGSDCTIVTGTASKSGQTITYTITNAVNVPAGTKIRLEFANINNPLHVSASYKVTVTTRDASNNIIDGPTQSNAYTIKQIGKNVIADGHITTPKIADGAITKSKISSNFMLSRLLEDDTRGESFGWNPNGVETNFIIFDDAIEDPNPVLINVGDEALNSQCEAMGSLSGFFTIQCNSPPPEGSELRYTIINLPPS